MNQTIQPRRSPGGALSIGRAFPILCVLGGLSVDVPRAGAADDDPRRDPVVALVERLGGELRRDEGAPGRPIVEVRLGTTRVTDEQFGALRGLSSMRTLDLIQASPTPAWPG